MSYPQTAESQVVSIPLKGMNSRDPLLVMDPNYSPWILNMDLEGQHAKVRKGYVRHCTPVANPWSVKALGVYGSPASSAGYKLFAYVSKATDPIDEPEIWDVSTTTPSKVDTALAAGRQANWAAKLKKRLVFMSNADAANLARVWDGSAWSAWGFTTPGFASGTGRVGISYNGRFYIFSGTMCFYGILSGIAGVTTRRDFDEMFEDSGDICWAAVMSSPGERSSEMYLAFGNTSGEVVIYSGDYPDSPTWALVGKFKISPPLGYNATVTYRNDTWLLTQTGVVSLLQLATKGKVAAEDQAISDIIGRYWVSLTSQLTSYTWTVDPVSGCFWPEKNKIFILMPGHINSAGAFQASISTMFVYDCNSGAWYIQSVPNAYYASGIVYYNNNIYFISRDTVMTLSPTLYKDEAYNTAGTFAAIPYEMQGAYNNFGSQNKNKIIKGWEPVIKTDFAAASVGMQTNIDVGRVSTGVAHCALIDGVNVNYYMCGGKGSTFQWVLKGDSDIASTDGLELYSMGVIA